MLWAIGDIHGNIPTYEGICTNIRKQDPDAITIQVGDMGIGFRGVKCPEVTSNDYFIAGNHDDALMCKAVPGYLGDFGVKTFFGKTVFFMRGAESYDKYHRIEGDTWWAYEELSYQQLTEAVKLYEEVRPEIVITHDCPMQVRERWFFPDKASITVQALTQMFHIHQPVTWAFGHHHRAIDDSWDTTRFLCLAEFQYKKIKFLGEKEE